MKKYFKIQIETASNEEAEILIASLSEIYFYAFEQEEASLNAYITEEDFNETELKNTLPLNTNFKKEIIEEENWNQQWEQSIEPVLVNSFAAIRPAFHEPVKGVKHEIIITPKMSFGTGHHATTFLMIEMMEAIDLHEKTVLDFGTGTGVLAILAEKCGASKVLAIDHDEWSINNALENIEANQCKNISVELRSDLPSIAPFDLFLGNINLNVLTSLSSGISELLKPGSFLLTSGFLLKDIKEMQNIFEEKGVWLREMRQRGDWAAILFQNGNLSKFN
ncbi:MAG TPA: 50S ribosomal protein L11 methyltransferase [Hanamia sp.]